MFKYLAGKQSLMLILLLLIIGLSFFTKNLFKVIHFNLVCDVVLHLQYGRTVSRFAEKIELKVQFLRQERFTKIRNCLVYYPNIGPPPRARALWVC